MEQITKQDLTIRYKLSSLSGGMRFVYNDTAYRFNRLTDCGRYAHVSDVRTNMPAQLLASTEVALDDAPEPCAEGCPGWALFDEGTERERIQRCDACARFASDDDAVRYVILMASAAERAGFRPQAIIDERIDPNADAWTCEDYLGRPRSIADADPIVCKHCGTRTLQAMGIDGGIDANTNTPDDADQPMGAWREPMYFYCTHCEDDSAEGIPRSEWTDPGIDEAADKLVWHADRYIEGRTDLDDIRAFWGEKGSALVRSHPKEAVVARAKAMADDHPRREVILDALEGRLGAAFLASVYPML